MSIYGIPILGIDTMWREAPGGGATDPHLVIYVNTPNGERTVMVRHAEGGGLDWQVLEQGDLEAGGHMPTPDAPPNVTELALLEDAFDIVCAAFYGDYESLNGEVESWL